MTSRSPIILIDKLRRAGLSFTEIARRTDIYDATLRQCRNGKRDGPLPDAAIARLVALAAEVCTPR